MDLNFLEREWKMNCDREREGGGFPGRNISEAFRVIQNWREEEKKGLNLAVHAKKGKNSLFIQARSGKKKKKKISD